ncbi:hypothetical protein CGMCC3_g6853 [Colletotrichum fructicola]|nr:uncharacterized protein CGMCC3_g6853 [Colletotrichum fructicola]KAE9577161.1 hypothetical protein CGMCC3_g6853 [Colletotrichum fructicola]
MHERNEYRVWDKNRTKKVSTALQIWGRWGRGVFSPCVSDDDDGTPGAHQAGEALLDVAADDGEAVRQSKLVFLA